MDPLLAQGLELTVVGVAVVFGFLVALVGAVAGMSWTITRLGFDAPEPAAPEPEAPAQPPPAAAAAVDAATLAVIREAVRLHREARR